MGRGLVFTAYRLLRAARERPSPGLEGTLELFVSGEVKPLWFYRQALCPARVSSLSARTSRLQAGGSLPLRFVQATFAVRSNGTKH